MHDQKDQFSHSYSLIGMDLFTFECPDLKTFKRMLVKGDYKNNGAIHLTDQVDRSLAAVGISRSADNDQTLTEDLLVLVMKRALLDTHLGHNRSEEISLSVVIHNPLSTINGFVESDHDGSNISLENIIKIAAPSIKICNSKIVQSSFESALEQTLFFSQNQNCDLAAFFSFFINSNHYVPNFDSFSPNKADKMRPGHSLGLGCIVFSNQYGIEKTYADLILEKTPHKWEDNKNQFRDTEYLSSVPIIRLIRSAININDKTFFPSKREEITEDPSQRLMRPWFALPYEEKRKIDLSINKGEINRSSIRLEKGYRSLQHPDRPFLNFGFFLLPIGFDDPNQAIQKIEGTINEITDCPDLASFINTSLSKFIDQKSGAYTLVILGSSKQELVKELEHAQSGISSSLESGKDWQTPVGSFFTPNPFGPKEKIAFVYPGAFSTYIGMGSEIFYLFPQLYDALLELTPDPGTAINEKTIFPQDLTSNIREKLQDELNNNPTQMISSGICFSFLFTVILRDILKVKPDSAFGYSLGENSMMFAMGLWSQADAMRTSLETSPIFRDRVSGPQNTIRDFWNMPSLDNQAEGNPPIWANYVLMAPIEKVREALQDEQYVYITHVNTPRQVVIGGKPERCQRVVEAIKCMYLQAPYHHAIHCEPVASEFEAFRHLHNWPVEIKPDIPIYTAANYGTLQNDSEAIAESFAKMLTKSIDFPRLINLSYDDGARIFIELGAGSNCSKWVDATLKGKPHTALSINQNNIEDHVSILKLIARLVSHQIPVNLKAING
jgi:PfaB family protein